MSDHIEHACSKCGSLLHPTSTHLDLDEVIAEQRIQGVPEKPARDSWNQYFMKIAKQVATRSSCDRKHVGAVVVRDRNIVATGYNGSIRGQEHCDDVGHLMVDGHCVRTVHAEANAIAQAAKNGARVEGAMLFVTAYPCIHCFKLVANAGVLMIAYEEAYRPDPVIDQFYERPLPGTSPLPMLVQVVL